MRRNRGAAVTPFVEAFFPREHFDIDHIIETYKVSRKEAKRWAKLARDEKVYRNETHQVVVADCGSMVHLSIKRIDREVIHDWRDLQEIKNALVGPECEGLELYPAESRLVDCANQYHLWVFKQPGRRIPVGFNEGRMVSEESRGKSKQRPFNRKEKAS